jgi:sugar phosphate isomerase/epimerase
LISFNKTTLTKNMKKSFILLLLPLVFVFTKSHAQKKWGGMTLYTVRTEMVKDPKGTLKTVSDLGYKYIEAVEYKDGKFYGMSPAEFKAYTKSIGLKPLSVHMGMMTTENADQLIADAKTAGFKYFVAPVPIMGMIKFNPKTRTIALKGDIKDLAQKLNIIARKAHAQGLKFLYHNHDFEFEKDSTGLAPIDYLLQNLDAKYVNFQMDLYWAEKAGVDPLTYFKKYPGRFKVWHVKDMDEQGRFAPVGQGKIDFGRILKSARLAGMKYYIVEQDMVYDGLSPIEAIKLSREGLTRFGFK